jgi:MFS family permease
MGKTTAKVLRAIVRNNAMKEDPDEIYNWRVFALVFSSCFGGMLFGWETGAIGGVLAMDATQERYGYAHWDKKDKSLMDQNIVSTLQIGCWVSCYFTGWLADRYGRRLCLIGTGLFTIIGVVFQAASAAQGTIAVMYVGRFLAGLGVGAASTLVPLYVSECVPRAVRGGLTGMYSRGQHLACNLTMYSVLSAFHRDWCHDLVLVGWLAQHVRRSELTLV